MTTAAKNSHRKRITMLSDDDHALRHVTTIRHVTGVVIRDLGYNVAGHPSFNSAASCRVTSAPRWQVPTTTSHIHSLLRRLYYRVCDGARWRTHRRRQYTYRV